MNRVEVNSENIPAPDWAEAAATFVTAVCDTLKCENWDTSVLFCSDKFMQELNRRFRNKDETTDILSFSIGETTNEDGIERYTSGDIAISLETLKTNSRIFNVDEDEELRRLLIHGILHLKGMDHVSNAPEEEMLLLQEKLLSEIKYRIIDR
ncbi:MAG: rRNA maturation RNase YbeY [Spirochaetaceae bacterium]|jgi:probable rRNA maturation factor|nr:rRNA maturation RNase YbeY [Spirochaetaceae bacterium]